MAEASAGPRRDRSNVGLPKQEGLVEVGLELRDPPASTSVYTRVQTLRCTQPTRASSGTYKNGVVCRISETLSRVTPTRVFAARERQGRRREKEKARAIEKGG